MLVYQKRYPEAETYEGKAYNGFVKVWTPRIGLKPLDDVTWLIKGVVETVMWAKGADILELKIYQDKSTHAFIPAYDWIIQINFHGKSLGLLPQQELAWPAALIWALAIAIVALGIGVAVWLIGKGVHTIFWSKGGEVPTFPGIVWIAVGVAILAGIGIIVYAVVKKKPVKEVLKFK